jgi:hypothetical protein
MRFIGGFIGLPLMLCRKRVSLTRRRENGMTRAARVTREALTAIRRRFTVTELPAHGRRSEAEKYLGFNSLPGHSERTWQTPENSLR